jgi:hypothetical protein|tara:strand:- start:4714 stop:6231 length:1518 start_codon:yes stop_codon:yes gene_type:complete
VTTAVRKRTKAELQRQYDLQDAVEIELCKQSFPDFLDRVYILERPLPHLGIEGGAVPFQKWPYLMEFAQALLDERLLVVGKARQLGFSWVMSAYATWRIWSQEGYFVLELSRGQSESQELLSKAKYIYKHLPKHWQRKIAKDSGTEFSFEGSESKIIALPATEDAGTGFTASLAIQDEAEKHEYLDASYLAVKPTIDAGGQCVMGSSRKKMRGANFFINTYRLAPSNRWAKKFWHVFERPGRDEQWYKEKQKEAEGLQEAQEVGIDLFMEQEYPRSETEFLKASSLLAAFDADALDSMKEYVKKPVQTLGSINIYQKWRLGARYMAGTDMSHGVGKDYSVTTVMDASSGYVVADIMSNAISLEDLSYQSIKLMEMYKNPIWGIEDNDRGYSVIQAAQRANYPSLFHRETSRRSRKVGWHTDNVSRWILWGELIEAVNARLVEIPNGAGLDQFSSVIRNPEKDGKIEALSGAHDDYPTAIGITWQMRKHTFAASNSGTSVVRRSKW